MWFTANAAQLRASLHAKKSRQHELHLELGVRFRPSIAPKKNTRFGYDPS